MSRIGKTPIAIPSGVTVTIEGNTSVVKGPNGEHRQAGPRRGRGGPRQPAVDNRRDAFDGQGRFRHVGRNDDLPLVVALDCPVLLFGRQFAVTEAGAALKRLIPFLAIPQFKFRALPDQHHVLCERRKTAQRRRRGITAGYRG